MAEKPVAARAHYVVMLLEAIQALGGEGRPAEVFDWMEADGRIREADARELVSGGPRWRKETYFAAMVLVRAGLLEREQRGVWRTTDPGGKIALTPDLAALLVDATAGNLGVLTLERSYAAIREAALARRFISYSEVARASGADWSQARRLMPRLLGRLVVIAHVRGWPMLSAIVVSKDAIATGRLEGGALEGFLAAARTVGHEVQDPQVFLADQQERVFGWASGAPERLGAEGRAEDEPPKSAHEPEAEVPAPVAPGDAGLQFWIGGALWSGSDDQMDRFLAEGIWQCGDDELGHMIGQMREGDRIAIKASFVRKHSLPFDAAGQSVSAMRIKATGTVTANRGDGRTVDVRWDPVAEPRDWYFYTFRRTSGPSRSEG